MDMLRRARHVPNDRARVSSFHKSQTRINTITDHMVAGPWPIIISLVNGHQNNLNAGWPAGRRPISNIINTTVQAQPENLSRGANINGTNST